jgi:zinc protease
MEWLQRGSRVSLIVVMVAVGCGPARGPLRYGSLVMGDRGLDYKPGIEVWTLPNKLTVAIAPDDRANIVSVDVRYRVGAAADPQGKTGLAHLVEHMMFELRSVPNGPTLAERLALVALGHNAYTTSDATHYSEIGLASSLDELLAIEATRMVVGCRGLDQATFERERAVVVQELAERGQRGRLDVGEALQRELFGAAHAYAHTAAGIDVARLALDDVCAFVDAYYAPATAILVVSGPPRGRGLAPDADRPRRSAHRR